MEKNTGNTSSGPQKDSFKNTPHTSTAAGSRVSESQDASISLTGRDKISDVKNRIVEQAGPAMESLRTNFQSFSETARPYLANAESVVRRQPMYAVLGAAALGMFVGMMIARPSSRV
jgi:ElaB/YqjD/DUF883 family membrane-anchored ribosome-binding protein